MGYISYHSLNNNGVLLKECKFVNFLTSSDLSKTLALFGTGGGEKKKVRWKMEKHLKLWQEEGIFKILGISTQTMQNL